MVQQQLVFNGNKDRDDIKAFENKERKFNDYKLHLDPILKKNKEERALLSELSKQINALSIRGIGSRSRDFLDEYQEVFR